MYDDLERPPLRVRPLNRALASDGWRVEVLTSTPSTNAVLADRARAGESAGLVIVAEAQTAGRGRLGRTWSSPPRAGLTFSVLLRPTLEPAAWGWLPLLSGVAVARALREQTGVDAVLKWPNDVLIDGRKTGGLLAEAVLPGAVVMGIGLNVTTRRRELPHEEATSLQIEGATTVDRDTVLRAILRELTVVLADVDAGRSGYRALCSTLGRRVRIDLPSGAIEGVAESVDDDGRLVVAGSAYGAGDVLHLRPVTP